uniref:Peptidase M16 C-terminal domain-containing protein n=1 Tax=Arcella intermedia TaxID=1963864 RepID=A0A6B2L3V9_9EUKA
MKQPKSLVRYYSTDGTAHLKNTPLTKLTQLPSGIRVASGEGLGGVATVGLWIDAGSANETDSNNGVSNFFQTVALKGAKAKDIEALGGSVKGSAGREFTSFVAQARQQDVPQIVGALSDIVQSTSWSETNIESTRSGITSTLSALKHKGNFQTVVDHAHASAFQGTPYAAQPLGELATVKKITASDLAEYQKNFVTAPNVVVVGTGDLKHDELVALVEKHFSLPAGPATPAPGFVDFVGSEMRIRDDTVHLARAAFCYQVVARSHALYWPTRLLKVLLGAAWKRNSTAGVFTSSRLAETMGGEKLANEYQTFYAPYKTTGIFGVYLETTEGKLEDATYEVFNEYQKLASYINPQELSRAKNQLKLEILSAYEKQEKFAEDLAESVLSSSRVISVAEQWQRIDDIQVNDVLSLLQDYFTDVDPVVVAHGNTETLPDFNILRGWTYWNRW